jgi:hypothetical protein
MFPLVAITISGLANTLAADDQAEARKIIDRAIQAVGGSANLAKYPAATWKAQVIDRSQEVALNYTVECAYQPPAQYRMAAELQGVFTLVVAGNQGWLASGGITRPMAPAELAGHHEELYALGLARLLLVKGQGVRLSLAAEEKVGDRPASGVKVSRQGRREVTLYFDKETGLLTKLTRRVKVFEQGGKEMLHETYFSDYKEFGGVKLACKITDKRDGRTYRETEISDVKVSEKLDNELFAKP